MSPINPPINKLTSEIKRLRSELEESRQELAMTRAVLHRREKLLKVLTEGFPGHGILALDTHGNIVSWTTEAERLYGYSALDVIGHNYALLFRGEDRQGGGA